MAVDSVCSPSPSSNPKRATIRVGVIGYGYWGPNVVRNLHGLDSACVGIVCDTSPAALARVRKTYPGILTTTDANEVFRSPHVDPLPAITPACTPSHLAHPAPYTPHHV